MSEVFKVSLKDVKNLIENLGLKTEEFHLKYIENFLRNNWVEIVGEGYSLYTYPLAIKNDKLIVLVSHESFKMELEFKKSLILQKLNQLFGKNLITKLSYKQGLIPKQNKAKKTTFSKQKQPENTELYKLIPKTETIVTQQKLKELIDLFPKI